MKPYVLIISLLFVFTIHPVKAQTTAFLNDDEIRMISSEISGDRAYEHIRILTQWHRVSGSDDYFKSVDYIIKAAKEAGLVDVKFIEQPLGGKTYNLRSAELWMVEPVRVKLADAADHAVILADGSYDADVTAELIWVANASKDTLKNLDVTGKIVLTNGSTWAAANNAVWEKGAAGIVCFQTSEGRNPMDFPDQIGWKGVPQPPEGKKGTFAFIVSPRKGDILKKILETSGMQDYLATGKKTLGGRIVLKAKVDTDISDTPGKTGFVEGWIKGSTYHDQQIIVTAHLQEEKGSANDDGSGCSSILEIARTLNKMVKDGIVQQPLRDIRFWWTDEIYSEYRYFKDNPEEPKKFLANVHQDMVGANQALGSRVQHLIFAPHSRSSYLDAVFESIGNYLILTNNGFLSASRSGGYPRPFTRPIYSTRGSRQGYNARFVPYFNSSDHMCFIEGAIGVPAVATINWDDDYIHSSDDDMWQIDQTQLQRNALLIGSTVFTLAYATADDVPTFAGETFAQGTRRLGNDVQVAMNILRDSSMNASNDGWKDASLLIEQGILREIRAIVSSKVFAGTEKRALTSIEQLVRQMKEKESGFLSDLTSYYKQLHNKSPRITLSPEEKAAHKKVPVNNDTLLAYFENRDKASYSVKLHGLMQDEVLNFVDGKRSYYDIYKAVRAEQLAAGTWYYGTVTLEDVVKMLDAEVEAKAVWLRK
ncbi:MAG: M28 family peptidase [Bacteroidetes bacterium]|nr:MAG: M28 family peptidase [Bacteroidota bacterium]